MLDVAVILINYNTSTYTLESIQKVQQHTAPSTTFQIIVVDNCSEISDYKNLKAAFPKTENVALHRAPKNLGFGGGNMYGAQFANAAYLLFLNNDAYLQNDCLSILKTYMENHLKVGVTTAQNYDEQNNHVPSFDHNKSFTRLLFGRRFLERTNPKRYPKRKKKHTKPITVDWINGAFLFFKTEIFNTINGFDTNIFLYWEEMDLCERLRNHKYTSVLVPEAKIIHIQGVSIGTSKKINEESYISYLYVVKKHFGNFKYQLIKRYLAFIFLLKKKKRYLRATILNNNRMEQSLRHLQKERHYEE